jgi:hypothetical protein
MTPFNSKDLTMHYKSIVLQLLEQRPEIQIPLMRKRNLLQAVETLALELKAGHETWMEQLLQTKPSSDPQQISSEALELAIEELERILPSAPPEEVSELSLDRAMAFLRRHTPLA